ncbi:MAG: GNAT family N-acetyltransferase [Azospirillaceae bacterium]
MLDPLRYDRLTAADAEAHDALTRQGFGADPHWAADERRLLGLDAIRVMRRGGDLAACLSMVPMGQYFGGRALSCLGIATLTVAPPYKGGGVSTALLGAALEEAVADGHAIATLYATTLPVYRKVGFEAAGQSITYGAETRDLASGRGAPRLRAMTPEDRPVLERLKTAEAKTSAGLLDRHELLWHRRLTRAGRPLDGHIVEGRDGPEAYAVVDFADRDSLVVADWAAKTAAGARGVLAYLAGYRSSFRSVTWTGAPIGADPLVFHMPDKGWRIERAKTWLTRIVDVERALAGRGYPPGLEGGLRLKVSDSLLAANEGEFLLEVGDGAGRVTRIEPGPSADGQIALDVAALAPLFTGHACASFLARAERLTGTPAAIAAADLIFAGPKPWMADGF